MLYIGGRLYYGGESIIIVYVYDIGIKPPTWQAVYVIYNIMGNGTYLRVSSFIPRQFQLKRMDGGNRD